MNEEITVYTPDLTDVVWRKSSRSNGGGGQCVEVAFVPGATALRDSKHPTGDVLILSSAEWHMFRTAIKMGSRVSGLT